MKTQFESSVDKSVAYFVIRSAGKIKNDSFTDFDSLLIKSHVCTEMKTLFGRHQYIIGSTK